MEFNVAYFQEIIIDNKIDQRIVRTYEENFLTTKYAIYLVLKMFARRDYSELFQKSNLKDVTCG